jgi:hypothetical protein
MTVDTEPTETSTHPDLPEEQAYLDRAYECLEDMRQQAARGARIVVAGDPYYIGRRHVHDQNLDPVVIDWRAPVAEALYQASWDDPWELERRRSFL